MDGALALERFDDVNAWLAVVEPFLVAREAEHNLLLGIASTLRDDAGVYPANPLLLAATRHGSVTAAAVRTDPWRLVLSETADREAVEAMVAPALSHGSPLSGVLGPPEPTRWFSHAVTARTGLSVRCSVHDRIYRLTAVRPLIDPPGRWRHAAERDVATLAAWLVAFHAEAVPYDPPITDPVGVIRRWLDGERATYVWEVVDALVALACAGSPTPSGIRLGPVYTPPEHRGHGFGRALTAAASEDQLARGRRFCFLYTDAKNPASNRIYRQIGYEPVGDAHAWVFEALR